MQHHAYGIYGESSEAIPRAIEFIERTYNVISKCNPDFEIIMYDTFAVAEARALKARALLLPLIGNNKVFIVIAKQIRSEAQNALLKLLEEPPSGVVIVLSVPYATMLIPTVLSRLLPIPNNTQTKIVSKDGLIIEITKVVHMFLQSNQFNRIAYVKKAFTGNATNPQILRDNSTLFLDIVEKFVYKKYKGSNDVAMQETLKKSLEDIETLRQYLYEKTTQARMLFEHLAIVLPTINV